MSYWVSEKVTSREAIASKNSPLGPQKVKNDPKIKSKSNVRIEGNIENESCSSTWLDPENSYGTLSRPPNQPIRAQKDKNDPKLSQIQMSEFLES